MAMCPVMRQKPRFCTLCYPGAGLSLHSQQAESLGSHPRVPVLASRRLKFNEMNLNPINKFARLQKNKISLSYLFKV